MLLVLSADSSSADLIPRAMILRVIEEARTGSEAVTFTGVSRRLAVVGAAWALIGMGCAYLVLIVQESLLAGQPRLPSPVFFVVMAVLLPAFTGWFVVVSRRRPPYVRIGPEGIELAGNRRKSVFVPWSAVNGTRFRGSGLLTDLQVTVADPDAVVVGHRRGRRPCQRHRDGRYYVAADVWALPNGPKPLRAELMRGRFLAAARRPPAKG